MILTNGYQWEFFLSKVKYTSKDNRYFSIDLTKDDQINENTKYLSRFLGFDSIKNGEAKNFAEKLLSQRLEREKAKEMVEIAWDSLLQGPDELLVELLIESVVNLCGIKPEVEFVKTFLNGKRDYTTLPSNGCSNDEKIVISPNDVSILSHTRLTSARFGNFRPAKLNWKNIQILALTSVLDVCKDLEELQHISQAKIVKGYKTDKGYVYVPSHQISFQLKSAPSTANVVKRCANFLEYKVFLEFEWKKNPNAFQPGKKGSLTFFGGGRIPITDKPPSKGKFWTSNGVFLPEGTQLQMEYNGNRYFGEIEKNYWVVNGNIYKSPSAAANDLARTKEGTRTQLNGWKYWKVKRPEDKNWQFLDTLRISNSDTSEPGHIDLNIEIDEIKFD